METTLAQKSIGFALSGEWEKAISANLEILKDNPEDTDALNRLARAYSEVGKATLARETTQKVLKIDPTNTIAQKCLEKWRSAKNGNKHTVNKITSPESFLEEPGKTKLITLVNPGDDKVLGSIDSGEEVKLLTSSHRVSIMTSDDKYIGRLPDDLAARVISHVKSGNKYQVIIKSSEPKDVTVFMKSDSPSFPTEKIDYVSFTPPELVHKDAPQMSTNEDSIPED